MTSPLYILVSVGILTGLSQISFLFRRTATWVSFQSPLSDGEQCNVAGSLFLLVYRPSMNSIVLRPPGFSIDSSMALLRKGELTIVSGAPRGGYSGQVAFLQAEHGAERSLSVELVLSGPGLASSFGYDLTVVDFNGDG